MSGAAAAVRDRVSGWLGRRARVEATGGLRVKPAVGPDRALCAVVLILTALGLVMVFSASGARAAEKYGDYAHFFKRESIYAALGLVAFALALRTDYSVYRRLSYPLLFLTVGLLVAVLYLGTSANNAVRWFRVGPVSFQPAELTKFSLVLYLSVLLARNAERVRTFTMGFLPPLLVTGLMMGLLVLQPDLGTGVILAATTFTLMFVSGARVSYILLAVLAAVPIGWQKLILGEGYRLRRMVVFLNPFEHCHTDTGRQLCESLISFGSGGVTGVGLGHGRQKLFFLPEAHTDFIFAIVGEELGLVGVLGVVACFGVLVWRGLAASLRARDAFGAYLAFGITTLFGIQAAFNMGVALGLLPTKGLALPFISYGGSALVVSLFMAGVLGNISARNPEPRPTSLLWILRRRPAAIKNKRSERCPTIVVDVGRPRRPEPDAVSTPPASVLEEVPTERDER